MTERELTQAEYEVAVCVSHCCKQHGCKYGKETCVVVLGTHEQDHSCEQCQNDAAALRRDIQSLIHTIRKHGTLPCSTVAEDADQFVPFAREELFAKLLVELRDFDQRTPLPMVSNWDDEDDALVGTIPGYYW